MTAESCDVLHCRNERSWVITTLSCLIPLAGFEVSLIGRFSGVPRGSPADGMSSATCLEEAVIVLRRWPRAAVVAGVASQWRNSAKSNYTKANGIRSHAHAGKPV